MHGTAQEPIARSNTAFSSSQVPPAVFPISFEQAPEGSARFVLLALLVPALAALMAPFWLIVSHLASDAATRAVIAARPLLAVQLAGGFGVLVVMFGWPLVHLARGLRRRRDAGFQRNDSRHRIEFRLVLLNADPELRADTAGDEKAGDLDAPRQIVGDRSKDEILHSKDAPMEL